MKVSIIGVTGYGGLELVRILRRHPHVTIASVHSHSMNTQTISEAYPHLKQLIDLPLEPIDTEKIMATSELVFFATPSGISKDLAIPFVEAGFPVIDLSGDFRLNKAGLYEKWYGKSSAPIEFIQQAEYGLSEFRDRLTETFIANPGCYATATLLSLAPLVQQHLIEETSIIVDAKSGISGAGKNPSAATHFAETNENMSLYKMNSHQHIPEIMQQLQAWNEEIPAIQFSTSLIPVTRGIFVTTYAKAKVGITEEQLFAIFQETYQDKPFVRIQEPGVYPTLKQVVGSNYCDIGLAYNEVTQMITIVTVIDNLVKGAAGQAIQNLNILAGYPETAGLEIVPIYP